MTLGQKLKRLREENDLTLEELAKIFKLGKSTISNYERDYRKPDINLLKQIADYFHVSIDWLIGRVDERDLYIMEGNEIPKQLRDIGIEYLEVNEELKKRGFTPEKIMKLLDGLEKAGLIEKELKK